MKVDTYFCLKLCSLALAVIRMAKFCMEWFLWLVCRGKCLLSVSASVTSITVSTSVTSITVSTSVVSISGSLAT